MTRKANAAFDAAARQVAAEINPDDLPPGAHELDEYEDATKRTTAARAIIAAMIARRDD